MDYFPESFSYHAREPAALAVEQRTFDPARTRLPGPSSWSDGIQFESLANLAHELRTPVQVLLGYLDILRDDQANGCVDPTSRGSDRTIIERMNTNVHELAHTVENVLEYALSFANAEPAIEEEISILDFFAELDEFLDVSRHHLNLAVHINLDNAPSTFVTGRRALRSIVLNLATNAIKFTCDGEVTICARRGTENSNDLEVEVRDTGTGISCDLLASAFEPLVQLSCSSIRQYRGLGLGLALVQRNVKALGGSLLVESVVGAGSCFKVTIPCSGPCSGSAPPMRTSSHSNNNMVC